MHSSHKLAQPARRQASPSASTVASVPCSVQHEDLDQLSSRLRKAFMGASDQEHAGGHAGGLHGAKGGEGGESCDESVAGGERGVQGMRVGPAVRLEPQQQSELAAVQQQVALAAQLLRAQADRLQVGAHRLK